MKILIIGNGLIATALIQRLESEGHELLIFSRTPNQRIHSKQIVGDIFNFEEFMKVLAWNPQIVIHTAWITTPGLYRNDSSNYKYAEFTVELARIIAFSDVEQLIVLGTCAEYGYQLGPSTAGVTKLSPNTLYAEQKVTAFKTAKELLQGSNTRLTWARIFYPYGPNQDKKRLIPQLIQALRNHESFQLTDRTSIHDWITTRDIASAISWAIENEVPTEIDVGTSFGFTNLELLLTLEDLLQTTLQQTLDLVSTPGQGEVFVVGKNSPLLVSGWSPTDSLVSGLEWVLS
jgi:nucleoside-diphosphate-sugar epimerase